MSASNLLEYLPLALFPVLPLALVLAGVGVALAPFTVWFAHRRSARQPLLLPIIEEQHLLARLVAALSDPARAHEDPQHPGQWLIHDRDGHDTGRKPSRTNGLDGPLRLVLPSDTEPQARAVFDLWGAPKELTRHSFASQAHGDLLEALIASLGNDDSVDSSRMGPAAAAIAALADSQSRIDTAADSADTHRQDIASDQSPRAFKPLIPRPEQATLVELAETIEMSHEDRTRFSGRIAITPTTTPDSIDPDTPPLHRVIQRPGLLRYVSTAVLMGTMFSLIPAFIAAMVRPGWGQSHTLTTVVLAGLAFSVLIVASMIIAWVDVDTMYVDLATLAVGTLASWGLSAAALVLFGEPKRLLFGFLGVVGVVIVFEVFNMVYRLIRGRDGQGFGDTLVIAMTLGVPVALTGVISLAIWIVLAAQLTGMVAAVIRGLLPRGDLRAPFAFVPWLTAGWVLALIVLVADVDRVLIVR